MALSQALMILCAFAIGTVPAAIMRQLLQGSIICIRVLVEMTLGGWPNLPGTLRKFGNAGEYSWRVTQF
jgi:hypothetical protein